MESDITKFEAEIGSQFPSFLSGWNSLIDFKMVSYFPNSMQSSITESIENIKHSELLS